MHTARAFTVSRGAGYLVTGVYLVTGGVLSHRGYLVPGGVCPGGCLPRGGVPAQVSPLCTEFLTHAYENITLPKLRLRAVIMVKYIHTFVAPNVASGK